MNPGDVVDIIQSAFIAILFTWVGVLTGIRRNE